MLLIPGKFGERLAVLKREDLGEAAERLVPVVENCARSGTARERKMPFKKSAEHFFI